MKKIFLLLFFMPFIFFSQTDGTLNGYVYDSESEMPLLGANIIIEGLEKGAVSDENGFFEILDINPKTYNLIVSYVGYQSKKSITQLLKVKESDVRDIFNRVCGELMKLYYLKILTNLLKFHYPLIPVC